MLHGECINEKLGQGTLDLLYLLDTSCSQTREDFESSTLHPHVTFASYFLIVKVIINQPILVSNFLMVLAYVAVILPPCCNRIFYNPLFETILKSHVLFFASFLLDFYKATWFAIVMFLGRW